MEKIFQWKFTDEKFSVFRRKIFFWNLNIPKWLRRKIMNVINCWNDRHVACDDCFRLQALLATILIVLVGSKLAEASYIDNSVKSYQAERTCGYNEICKEEFRKIFRCKCPNFLVCRWDQQQKNFPLSWTYFCYESQQGVICFCDVIGWDFQWKQILFALLIYFERLLCSCANNFLTV